MSVSIVLVRAFVEVVERTGVGRDQLLLTTSVDPKRMCSDHSELTLVEKDDAAKRWTGMTPKQYREKKDA